MRLRTRILGVGLFAAAILGVSIVVLQYSQSRQFMPPAQFMPFIQNADRVELIFDNRFERESLMVDAEEARQLVSGLELVPKQLCPCLHYRGLIFWQGDRKLEVSICDHCFDVISRAPRDTRPQMYKMPPAFYARFQELESQYRSLQRSEAEPAHPADE